MAKGEAHYEVIVSAEAETMLLEHTRFLARVSTESAERLVVDFLVLVDSLETMPERFPPFIRNGYHLEGYHKALFAGRYLAIFCIESQTVYLDFVVDCRRDNLELLGGIKTIHHTTEAGAEIANDKTML